MAYSPLFRLPCILVAMVGFHKTLTPPHPPITAQETAPSTTLEIILKQRASPLLIKTVTWGFALAEVAVILSSKFEHHELSRVILSKLVRSGDPANIRPTRSFLAGILLVTFGSYIRWSCFRAMGRLFTFEMSIRDDHKLISDGPYAWVRHPAYTGIFSIFIGLGLWHATEGSYVTECGALNTFLGRSTALLQVVFLSIVSFGLVARMAKEDDALRKEFGKQWDEWAKRVPYKLIPWIY